MASILSRRQLIAGLVAVVTFTVLILSTNTNLNLQGTAPLQNARRLHPSNIHKVAAIPTEPIDFSSSSYEADFLQQPDDAFSMPPAFAANNVNATWGKQGIFLGEKLTSTDVKEKGSSPVQYYDHNKYRPYSPGKAQILHYIDRQFPTKLKKEVTTQIAQFNQHNNVKFLSLPNGRMWYVFTNIMKSLGYEQRLPLVILIGVKKSGTTALGYFLGKHPQISHSFGNEIHFFDKPDKMKKGIDYYRSKMGFSNVDQLPFEKTPKYFITKDAPKAILKNLPKDIKFILCVRDPVERAISEYHHDTEYVLRRKQKSELLKAKQRSPEEQGKLFTEKFISPQGYVYQNRTTTDTSIYSKHLKNWLKKFPLDRFLIVDLGSLQRNAYVELKRIQDFLGLVPFFTPSMIYRSEKRGTCLKINRSLNCPGRSTPGFTQKAKLGKKELTIMYDFYRPYNQEFARLTGKQFNWMQL
ncbi:heparan sulfate glucosamine 3-O-sulfotransferase 5-like [Anneissia japonica]|uniref:heparan sulfate glucosamine 3-O-sulfotransferase 5-like n=1 Tax=Anneissia japonica TaxID=1529436 RepID=UPI0014256C4A|nr:heparan sulfate glucosamine 3-O-sulfotransferase 5-like [Anneissia japonica]XP_033108054.1 heparan sulfate glucosamine 3-O-sulfotransferase 5-like [Anneissia japonica]XP_033108056.1 heparan sulfate glucosamine 3-O-sulfotransferase 5-like [Anneissia japonica]